MTLTGEERGGVQPGQPGPDHQYVGPVRGREAVRVVDCRHGLLLVKVRHRFALVRVDAGRQRGEGAGRLHTARAPVE
ncbi:hypothetical protein [Streptomyces sp. Tu 2975]|uniref:hypothetical protein n=1 Tax=Streptomyces sp. Tu 2975 TaxID=2676871 RepID=UPI001FC90B45|nr:hypothetical protein [Streptomyces sp. Tu 2975]